MARTSSRIKHMRMACALMTMLALTIYAIPVCGYAQETVDNSASTSENACIEALASLEAEDLPTPENEPLPHEDSSQDTESNEGENESVDVLDWTDTDVTKADDVLDTTTSRDAIETGPEEDGASIQDRASNELAAKDDEGINPSQESIADQDAQIDAGVIEDETPIQEDHVIADLTSADTLKDADTSSELASPNDDVTQEEAASSDDAEGNESSIEEEPTEQREALALQATVEPALNGLVATDGKTFYYLEGLIQKGQRYIDGYWYYFDPDQDGAMATGFITHPSQNKTVYYDEQGHMRYGQQKIGEYWYNFSAGSGAMKTGFVTIPTQSKTVYYNDQGRMLYGQQKIGGYWYYFRPGSGAMATGFVTHPSQNKTVYYNSQGRMRYGQAKINNYYYWFEPGSGAMAKERFVYIADQNKWVYYNDQGHMLYGQQKIGGYWYFFNRASGKRTTGFVTHPSQNKTVYYNNQGRMLYGQQKIGNYWYYFRPGSGAMQTGFVRHPTQNKTVYYNAQGRMLYGQQYIDNYWYYFRPGSGAMATGWVTHPSQHKTVYYNAQGRMLKGTHTIDGIKLTFAQASGAVDQAGYLRWLISRAWGYQDIGFFNGGTCSAATLARLQSAVRQFQNANYLVGFLMMDLTTGKGVSFNTDTSFYSASTSKGPYVASLYQYAFGDNAQAANTWWSHLYNAIRWSDNNEYYYLRNAFGGAVYAQWLADMGLDSSKAYDYYTWYTPRQLSSIWAGMYSYFSNGAAGGAAASLYTQSYYSAINAELGGQYRTLSKPGWYPLAYPYTATNDAGIVYSGSNPYLVVTLSAAPVRVDMVRTLVRALHDVHEDMVS